LARPLALRTATAERVWPAGVRRRGILGGRPTCFYVGFWIAEVSPDPCLALATEEQSAKRASRVRAGAELPAAADRDRRKQI